MIALARDYCTAKKSEEREVPSTQVVRLGLRFYCNAMKYNKRNFGSYGLH